MPYRSNKDLPLGVKRALPQGAQTIFRKAFNNAYRQYRKNEVLSFRVAWSAVKRTYEKRGGKWRKKALK